MLMDVGDGANRTFKSLIKKGKAIERFFHFIISSTYNDIFYFYASFIRPCTDADVMSVYVIYYSDAIMESDCTA